MKVSCQSDRPRSAPAKQRDAEGAVPRRTREGTPAPWPESSRQARCPARAMAAGFDAASMARRCPHYFKSRECLSPPAQVLPRQGGRGLVSQAVAPRRWASVARIRRCRARPASVARTSFSERPRKSRPFRPDFRWPHACETSPCPPCRRQDLGRREAQNANRKPQTANRKPQTAKRKTQNAKRKTQNAKRKPRRTSTPIEKPGTSAGFATLRCP